MAYDDWKLATPPDADDGADHSSENDPGVCYECRQSIDDCECEPSDDYVPPQNREQAIAEIIQTGFTISALLAVAEAFPLEGEKAETDAALARWREADPSFVDYLLAERERYLVSWGKK